MDRPGSKKPAVRTYEQIVDSQDLRSVISDAIAATPLDDKALRRGVWTYVEAERRSGTAPAQVIITLTELVDASKFESPAARQAVMRNVILWCVEASFGHLGGDGVGRDSATFSDSENLTYSQ